MSKKFKVIISVLVAVLLLIASGTAVAMAQDEPELQSESGGLLARVASILAIPPEKLADAFQQARQEMREECQATGNCTIRQENENNFRQRWAEEEQEMGKRFQGNGTESQKNRRFRISQSVRGRQMIAVPEGWQGTWQPELIEQVAYR